MKYNKIKNLMIKKSFKTYFRMIMIFFFIFVVISAYLYFYIFNQSTNNKNFYDNKSAHVIRIQGKINDDVYSKLKKEDLEQIQDILKKHQGEYEISSIFKLSSGVINAANDQGVIIYGLDNQFSYMINNKFNLKDNILYSDTGSDVMKLIVPTISFTSNGDIISNSSKEIIYKIGNMDNLSGNDIVDSLILKNMGQLPILFTTQKTFLNILNVMFTHNDREGNSNKQIYDFMDIEEIFIYIDDLYSLSAVVKQLKDSNFYVTSAFDSLEDLSTDLFISNTLYNIVLVILIVLSSVYIILTYKNYLQSQQKDIAILKIFGYTENNIRSIYDRVLYQLMGIVFSLISLFNIAICFKNLLVFSLITIVELVVLIALTITTKIFLIQNIVKKDILFLLKYGKEFE